MDSSTLSLSPALRDHVKLIAKKLDLADEEAAVLMRTLRSLYGHYDLSRYVKGIDRLVLLNFVEALASRIHEEPVKHELSDEEFARRNESFSRLFGMGSSAKPELSELANEPLPSTPPWRSS